MSTIRDEFRPVFSAVLLCCCVAVLSFPGCAFIQLANQKLKPPTVAYNRAEVLRVTASKANINFHTKVSNPNSVGLQNVRISYQLFHEDKPFLKGRDLLIDLAPNAASPLSVPAEIVYTEVYVASSSAIKRVLAGDKTIPVRIDLVISGNPALYDSTRSGSLFPFTVNLSRTENIPVPREQLQRLLGDKALEQLRNRR